MHRHVWFFALLMVLMPSAGLAFALDSDPPESSAVQPFGSLEAYGTGLPQRGQWRNGFAVADINGDGFLDIVHGSPRKGRGWPVIFIGDGKGAFTRWAARFPRLPFDYGVVAVADFDGDGRSDDIAIGSHLRGMAVLAGDGKGEFKEWGRGLEMRVPEAGRDLPFCPGGLVAIDWNKDGRMDLAALAEGPVRLALRSGATGQDWGIRVFLNEAEQWRAVVPDQGARSLIGRSLAAGDVDGDGRPDLLAGSATLGFTRLLQRNNTGGPDAAGWTPLSFPARAFATAVALADLDGNGRSDPIVASSVPQGAGWQNHIQVHLSFPGRFETVTITPPEGVGSSFQALAIGDLDGDGQRDLVSVSEDGALSVFRGEKSGRFQLVHKEAAPSWRAGCSGYDVHLADLDRDGRDEIIASFAGEPSGINLQLTPHSGGGIQAWKVRTRTNTD